MGGLLEIEDNMYSRRACIHISCKHVGVAFTRKINWN
jgi:hypothetical protein